MAFAEEASVPEAGADNFVFGEPCNLHMEPCGVGVGLAKDSHLGLLTRSPSRKRLSPEGLAVVEDDAVPRFNAYALEAPNDPALSALLIGYRSCPGIGHVPDSFRVLRRARAGAGARGANRAVTAARNPRAAPPCVRPAPELEGAREQEVPSLAPAQADASVNATSAGSAFLTSVTSAGKMPSAPPPPWRPLAVRQPYNELLSGPGFSYAAESDGVFDEDEISLGSEGFMLESDVDDDDLNDEDLRSSRTWSAGTACSGSGERVMAVGLATAAAAATAATMHAATAPDLRQTFGGGGNSASADAVTVVQAGATLAAEVVLSAGGGSDDADATSIDTDADISPCGGDAFVKPAAVATAAAAPEDEGGPEVVRMVSSESVGSAGFGNCDIPSLHSRTGQGLEAKAGARGALRGGGSNAAGAGLPVFPGYGTAAAGVAAAGGGIVGGFGGLGLALHPVAAAAIPVAYGAPLGNTAALGGPSVPFTAGVGIGMEELRPGLPIAGGGSVAAASAATAAATLPSAAAAVIAEPSPLPSLLPAEVYLGFVTQLVESVRVAARAVDEARQAELRLGGYGLAGHYPVHFAAAEVKAAGWVPGADVQVAVRPAGGGSAAVSGIGAVRRDAAGA